MSAETETIETTEPTEPTASAVSRLNINISGETAATLRASAEKYGISVTEAVRRAVAISKLFEDTREAGQTLQLVGPGDRVVELRVLI